MKTKTLSIPAIATLILAIPLAGTAQNSRQLQPNEHETNLRGATTIEAPPAGFDPITASDEDLAYHGFPPRPDQNTSPNAYAEWTSAMSASKTRTTPQLEQTGIFHGGAKATTAGAQKNVPAPPPHDNGLTSSLMSGIVDQSGATSYGPSSFYYAVTKFVVPHIHQAPGCTGNWDFASEWVGLDGWGSPDLLQAGVTLDAFCSGTTTASYFSAWFEWYPNAEVRISNLPVVPGDSLFVEVWHTSPTQGYAYLVNYNTNQSVQIGFTAYPGYPLTGNSAEWIVEDQVIGGTSVDFGMIPFWDSYAYTEAGSFYDIATGIPIVETYGLTTIASPHITGPESFVDIWY